MIKASSPTVVILLVSLIALSTAEPLRRRFSARQVQAPASPNPTGYPEAGVTPEVAFELPSSTAKPDVTYLPPDNTYGPPDNTYGPPASADVEPEQDVQPEAQPENPIETDDIPPVNDEAVGDAKQQPAEDEDEEILVQVTDDGTVIALSSSLDQPQPAQSARLYQRFPQGNRRREQPVPQRLILRRSW